MIVRVKLASQTRDFTLLTLPYLRSGRH